MTWEPSGPDLDRRRSRVASSGLTGPAVAALSPLVRALPIEGLTPVKQLLKRYFSDEPWTDGDDDALSDLVGAPAADAATERLELEPDLWLVWGWPDGRFRLRLDDGTAPVDD